ncbi:MAG: hypothetical protein M3454_18545 [Actinomycetota bacterium]|nr:hypothetical protein [Actinomycetota bacterium]
MDILAENAALQSSDEVDIGGGYGLRRTTQRARRGPATTARPFDASEFWLADRDLPDARARRTASLLYELRTQLATPPSRRYHGTSSPEDILATMKELDHRGFDGEALVREGIRSAVVPAIIFFSLVADVVAEADRSTADDKIEDDSVREWTRLLERSEGHDASGRRRILDAVTRHAPRLAGWVSTAPLEAIFNWEAPSPEEWEEMWPAGLSLDSPHLWLVDRFTRPYLNDWSTFSLKAEWKYAHAEKLPPCNRKEMKERRIDPDELDRAIAHRIVAADDNEDDEGIEVAVERVELKIDANLYAPVALKLLNNGEREAATALFEAAVALNDSDATAYNNLGFCLLPDHPKEALVALERAADLSFSNRLLNAANRLHGLAALGRYSSALELASKCYSEWRDLIVGVGSGYLWDFSAPASAPILRDVENIPLYVVALIRHAATLTGDEAIAEEWLRRTTEMVQLLETT